MNIYDLPSELLTVILSNCSPEDVVRFCETDSDALAFCQSSQFLYIYVPHIYEVTVNSDPSPWDKFKLIYTLVRTASNVDINTCARVKIYGLDRLIIKSLCDFLVQVVQTDDFQLLRLVLKRLVIRFPHPFNTSELFIFQNSFTEAFLDAFDINNLEMVQLIIKHFRPNSDVYIYEEMVENAISSNKCNLLKFLVSYIPVQKYYYKINYYVDVAQNYNQPEIGNYLKSLIPEKANITIF
jgi:hypothetical protein